MMLRCTADILEFPMQPITVVIFKNFQNTQFPDVYFPRHFKGMFINNKKVYMTNMIKRDIKINK